MRATAHGLQLSLLEPNSPAAPRSAPGPGKTARSREAFPLRADDGQPELPLTSTGPEVHEPVRAALEQRLRIAVGGTVRLTITDNRRTMVSIRREGGARLIRLHHMFARAPAEIVAALGRYFARGDRFASRMIDRYIAENQHSIKRPDPIAPSQLVTQGKVYDLAQIQDALSAQYFEGKVRVDITWGRHATGKRGRTSRRTIRMGTYFIDEKLIRIHPALDQTFVPRYFVEWVVYHEMLHHVVPMPLVNGRRVYHSDEFRRREKLYADYHRARAWELQHLPRLIAARRVLATN